MDTKILRKISYGMYIVTSKKGDKVNGQTANTVFQVTSDPPTIAVSINKQNLTHEYISESKVFAVNILPETAPMKIIGHFGFKSGRDMEKFADYKYKTEVTGAPILTENIIGYIEAEVIASLDVGTHTIFVGKIVNGEILLEEPPMTYAYYHENKGGKSPKTAPTYIKEEKEIKPKAKKYECMICGYVYDPEKGDPENGIPPGTSFEDLPDDWTCPICGAGKEEFQEV